MRDNSKTSYFKELEAQGLPTDGQRGKPLALHTNSQSAKYVRL